MATAYLVCARAECEIARDHLTSAGELASELLRIAGDCGERSYATCGHLLRAEIACRQHDFESAAGHVAEAQASLAKFESWTAGWRVEAMADTCSRICPAAIVPGAGDEGTDRGALFPGVTGLRRTLLPAYPLQ